MLISILNTLLFLTVFMEQMFYMLFMEIHRLFLHLDLAFLSFPHANMEYAFEVGDALVVNGGNASQCVIGNLKETFSSFNYQQVCEKMHQNSQW